MQRRIGWVTGVMLAASVLLAQPSDILWQLPRGDERNSGFAPLGLRTPLSLFWYFLPLEPTRSNRFTITHDGQQIYLVTANTLICLDAFSGRSKGWKTENLPYVFTTPPIVAEVQEQDGQRKRRLFVGTTQGEVLAFDPVTGAEVGRISFEQNINSLGAYQGTLFIGTSDGYLHFIPLREREGKLSEEVRSVRLGYATTTAFAFGERKGGAFLCVGTSSQRLFFLQLQWGRDGLTLREYARPLLPAGSSLTDPVYDPQTDSVFVGASNFLIRVTSWGMPTQLLRLKGSVKGTPVLTPDGTLFVGTDAGIVYAISTHNLAIKWQQDVKSPVQAPMLATGDLLWVVTFEGMLLALDTSEEKRKEKEEKDRMRWRFRLADIDPNLTGVAVLAPIAAAPFGLCVADTAGRIYAFTEASLFRDTTPPTFYDPLLLLHSATRQLVGYYLHDDPVMEEAPAIPGRTPIYLRVRLLDSGTGIDEKSLKAQLIELRPQPQRVTDLTGEFNAQRGEWSVNIYTERREESKAGPTRRSARVLKPLLDGEYLVVLHATDYAGNKAEGRFAFRVDNTLPPPQVQTAQQMPGAPGIPGGPGVPGQPPGAPGGPYGGPGGPGGY